MSCSYLGWRRSGRKTPSSWNPFSSQNVGRFIKFSTQLRIKENITISAKKNFLVFLLTDCKLAMLVFDLTKSSHYYTVYTHYWVLSCLQVCLWPAHQITVVPTYDCKYFLPYLLLSQIDKHYAIPGQNKTFKKLFAGFCDSTFSRLKPLYISLNTPLQFPHPAPHLCLCSAPACDLR